MKYDEIFMQLRLIYAIIIREISYISIRINSLERLMAQTKKKTKSKKTKTNKSSNTNKTSKASKDTQLRRDILAILMLACGVFFAMSMHTSLVGSLGVGGKNLLRGIFGLVGYVFPYMLILYSVFIFSKNERFLKIKNVIMVWLIFLMLLLINSTRFMENISITDKISKIYYNGTVLRGGGVIGTYVDKPLYDMIGSIGICIVAIVVIIIAILVLANTTITETVDKTKEKRQGLKKKREEEARTLQELRDERVAKDKDFFKQYENSFDYDLPVFSKSNVLDVMKENEADNRKPTNLKIKKADLNTKKTTKDDVDRALETLEINDNMTNLKYQLPPLSILHKSEKNRTMPNEKNQLVANVEALERTLRSFNVDAKVINVTKGSSVTRYEIQPAIGVKVASIVRLSDDIALNLRAKSIRVEAPIPGKAAVGIEVENETREMVTAGDVIATNEFKNAISTTSFAVGKDIAGNPVIADLDKMPHLLIAGATGAGKSVCINTIITSLLYKATPDEVKLVLIDPKMVELGNYNGIPHLLIPVVTDSAKAAAALSWAVAEMTDRYKKFADNNVRNLKAYNHLMKQQKMEEEILPKIVIIIDELADLMMVAKSQVEESICRLAQLARAAGMHLIVATQRPSVNVVTGLIKANIPSRIAFMVSSHVDSQTIIDMKGAEKLVGNGDMLYKPQDLDKPLRIQGPFISDDEVSKVIEFVKKQAENVEYNQDALSKVEKGMTSDISASTLEQKDSQDEFMDDAIELILKSKQASVSMLQRRFRIGYNRAARMIDEMEEMGIVGPPDGSRGRSVLLTQEEFEEKRNLNEKK